jgi:hypothetical protein
MRPQGTQRDEHSAAASEFQEALAILAKAADYARRTTGYSWDFAVEIKELRQCDLRFIVERGLIDHVTEVITCTGRRDVKETGELCFGACISFCVKPARMSIVG